MSNVVIVAGSRDFNDQHKLFVTLDSIGRSQFTIDTVVSGTAKGADKLGEKYAESRGITLIRMPANWDKYGKSAGYKRNEEMAKIATHCVVFYDGESKGTKHMMNIAKKYGLKLTVVLYKENTLC